MVVIDREIIIQSKLLPPEAKEQSIRRERLIKLLADNTDKKLIILNAGPGYGKTTLLAHFLERINKPYVFYRLDRSDSNIGVFISYLVAGLRKYQRNFGRRTISILKSIKNPHAHLDIIAGTLVNEIIKIKAKQFFIVFDDYHNVKGSKQISEIMTFFLHHCPSSIRFLIATRNFPELPLSQARIRNELFILSNDDLKFNKEDIRKLYHRMSNTGPSKNELRILEKYSEGWITCLQLMLRSRASGPKKIPWTILDLDILKTLPKYRTDYFNFFAHEVFDNEPEYIRTFMLECSFMEWLNADACNYLSGRRDAAQILESLESRNAFLFKVSADSYRWHRLFQDFLKFMVKKTGRLSEIIHKSADYLKKTGFMEAALPLYIDAHQFKKAIAIIKRVGNQMLNTGKTSMLQSCLYALPQKIRENDPDLLVHQAYAHMLDGKNEKATLSLYRAIRLYRNVQKAKTNLTNAYYMLSSVYFNTGRYDIARKWLVRSLNSSSKKKDLQRAAILNSLGLLFSRMAGEKLDDAINCFRLALQVVKKFPKNEGLEASILHNWASVERKAGNILSAYEKSLEAVNLLTKEGNFSPQCGAIFYNAARFSVYLGNEQNALRILKTGSRISKQYHDLCSTAIIERGYGMIHEENEEYALAKESYLKAFHKFENLRIGRMVLVAHGDLSRICIELGLFTDAKQHLLQVWKMKKTKNDAEAASILSIEAKLRIAQGELDVAEDILNRVLGLANKFGLKLERLTTLLDMASVLEKKNNVTAALEVLKQVIVLGRRMDYEKILAASLRKNPGLIKLLSRFEIPYGRSLLEGMQLPFHPVQVFLLDIPQVMVDGKTIPPGSWKTSRSFKFFCFLCLHHDKPVSRDIIIETIWRDSAPKRGSLNLRKASQHIRNAIFSEIKTKDDPILYRNKMYQLADVYPVNIDTDEFTALINDAKKLPKGHPDVKKNLTRALNMYKNDFAAGWTDEWVITNREQYQQYYESCLKTLADHCSRRDEFQEVLVYYRKLIAHNFYDEEYHQKLWVILSHLHQYNEIKKDFERLEQVYKIELKIDLQPETLELHNSLFRNQK